jgi:hypothetical protein
MKFPLWNLLRGRALFTAAPLFMLQSPGLTLERANETPPPASAPRAKHYSPPDGWVSHHRFWRSDYHTLIDAIIRVPSLRDAAPEMALETQVIVEDGAGNILLNEEWVDSSRITDVGQASLEVATPVRFVLAQGAYRMRVIARRGGVTDSASAPLHAYGVRPFSSDLLLSPSIRRIQPRTVVRMPEVAHGEFAVQTVPRPVVDTEHPVLWYYIELYPDDAERGSTAQLRFEIVRESDGRRFKGATKPLSLDRASVTDVGRLGLNDLAAGRYRLDISIEAPHRKERRTAAFTVARNQHSS